MNEDFVVGVRPVLVVPLLVELVLDVPVDVGLVLVERELVPVEVERVLVERVLDVPVDVGLVLVERVLDVPVDVGLVLVERELVPVEVERALVVRVDVCVLEVRVDQWLTATFKASACGADTNWKFP